MGKKWHVFIKSILHILLKSQTQKYHPTSLRNRMRGWEVCTTTLLKLPQNYRMTNKCLIKLPVYPSTFISTFTFTIYQKDMATENFKVIYNSEISVSQTI